MSAKAAKGGKDREGARELAERRLRRLVADRRVLGVMLAANRQETCRLQSVLDWLDWQDEQDGGKG